VDDSRKLESEQRQALVTHITRHLNEQDDQTLLLLADLLHEAPAKYSGRQHDGSIDHAAALSDRNTHQWVCRRDGGRGRRVGIWQRARSRVGQRSGAGKR